MSVTKFKPSENRSIPCSLDAEKAVLGVALLDDKAIYTARALLTPEEFYPEAHRRIFEAMSVLAVQGRPIEIITVKNELERMDALDKAGGAVYLASLTDGMPRALNVEHYARIVKDKAALRRTIQVANEAIQKCFAGEHTPEEVLNAAQQGLFRIAGQAFRGGFESTASLMGRVYKAIEEQAEKKSTVTGIPSGFPCLDKMTAGFQPGDLVILAARPAMGKTTLALNVAAHVALCRHRSVGIFSLEMTKEQLMKRLLAGEADVEAHRLSTGFLGRDDWGKIATAAARIAEARMHIDDTAGVSVIEVQSKARQLQMQHGLDLLVIDYLQLMSAGRRIENKVQEITEISKGLKTLAKELKIPIIALSQLSRAMEKSSGGRRRPQLSDLRESGSIEQDADTVIFLYEDDPANDTELIIGKQRNGPTGTVRLRFLREFNKFIEMTEREEVAVSGYE